MTIEKLSNIQDYSIFVLQLIIMKGTLNRICKTVFENYLEVLEKLDKNVDSENKVKGLIEASTGTIVLS